MARKQVASSTSARVQSTTQRLPFILLLLVAAAMPLFFWPGTTEYNYARTIFLLLAVTALLVARLVSLVRQGGGCLRVAWIILPLLGLLLAASASLVHARDLGSGLVSVAVLAAGVLFVFLTVDAVRERRHATLVLSALFLSACGVAVHAVLQYAGVLSGTETPGAGSMITTMGTVDAVAGFLACVILPAVILLDRARTWILRTVVGLGIAFLLATLLLTDQTGALIGLLLAAVAALVGWLLFPPAGMGRRLRVPILGVAVVLLACAAAFAVQIARTRPAAQGEAKPSVWEANSGTARSTFWRVGWTMFRENPLVGVGFGNYKIVYPQYEAQTYAQAGGPPLAFVAKAAHAHNDYLQVASELGAFGVAALVALLAVFAASLWKRLRGEAGSRFEIVLLAAGVVVFLVHALVGFPTHLAGPVTAAMLFAALALSPAYGERTLFSLRVGRWAGRAALAVALLAAAAVWTLASRDLAANVLQLRGTRELQTGRTQEALATLERSVALDFNPRASYFYLASAQYRLGEYDAALASLETCLVRFPDEHAYLLYADLAAGLGRLERGQEVLDFLLSTDPSGAVANQARLVGALILRQQGDSAAAASALRGLIDRAPTYEPAYIALGEIEATAGRSDSARSLYEQALALVDKALPVVQQTLSSGQPLTYAAYADAQERLADLTRERDALLRDLDRLSSPR